MKRTASFAAATTLAAGCAIATALAPSAAASALGGADQVRAWNAITMSTPVQIPYRFDERIHRDDFADTGHQRRQYSPLLRRTELDRSPPARHLERAEHPDLHTRMLGQSRALKAAPTRMSTRRLRSG